MSNHDRSTHERRVPQTGWCVRQVWALIAAPQPDDELDALRWQLLHHWAELHDLKCRCTLELTRVCRLPVPDELEAWMRHVTTLAPSQLRVVN